jgi:hypothetical protein
MGLPYDVGFTGTSLAITSRSSPAWPGVDNDGAIGFTNGRHRTRWLLKLGLPHIPVCLPFEQIDECIETALVEEVKKPVEMPRGGFPAAYLQRQPKQERTLPDPELKEWIALLKDVLLGLASIVTSFVGVYGVRAWKRDLVGKAVYEAARNLVKESYLVCTAAHTLREPLWAYEKRQFTDEGIEHTTKNERWRLSEAEGYKAKI